jgi:hypothetical protein
MAALMVTLCAGVTLDNWGHFHGRGDESFFTPWHAILYGAMTSYGIILVLLAVANKSRGCTWRAALPPGYTLSLLGVGTFILAGLADLGWHSVFGVESDTTAYMSPTHLLLLGSGVLAGTGPVRSAWLTLQPSSTRGWLVLGPMLVSAASAVAGIAIFSAIASPLVQPFAAKDPVGAIPTSIDPSFKQAFGVASVIVQTLVTMSFLLVAVRTWTLPFGALTLLISLPSAVQAVTVDNYWLIVAVLIAGLVAEVVVALVGGSPLHGAPLYGVATLVPALYVGSLFTALWITVGIAWPATVIAGSIVYASATGLVLSFVLEWPIASPMQR